MTRGAFAAGRACASSEVLADTRNVILTLCCRGRLRSTPRGQISGRGSAPAVSTGDTRMSAFTYIWRGA